ncbi:hypothetical protein [Amycolatopsis suaedae]|uniref:Uncharacterized protein n=1 Tax=Amycolatopsis suaedae TaxID=2510978 RepID=A0A4Q7JB09_9PSEU|nr:hypothetical protein [Amycolatopsis suaedae]RZQ64152.1 hypothetical protein EWH70_09150 [Amycolatopsis suaedae]
MRKNLVRVAAVAAFTGAVLAGGVAPALADPVIVDEPDTSELNNIWTFDPLGVPVLGLIQSVVQAPGRLLPS